MPISTIADYLGFRVLWSPYFFIVLMLILVGYFLITMKFRTRFVSSEKLTKRQATFFTLGIVLLYMIEGSQLPKIGYFYFHETYYIQKACLYLVIPPFLIIGIPQWIWRAIINNPAFKLIFNIFMKPLIALILFNIFFIFSYLTNIPYYGSYYIELLYNGFVFILAVFMWWPLVNQLPEQRKLSRLKKVGYIFLGIVIAFITLMFMVSLFLLSSSIRY
ncbi:cytochrome c oxidase assembly protein [Bacillus aquiflavi]|uniref:cytochrome c oxidase assembly protein n=1 Tax=Bacillus aquiflavi TaxID=2672567 RepID=UPI001CAA1BB1|nr:cytochrome c oxidase assembly protein [Bacillus aquiflavi]UAC47461.1 cytochrome c oxidase assembly protein [Bacillus aquiflavi]